MTRGDLNGAIKRSLVAFQDAQQAFTQTFTLLIKTTRPNKFLITYMILRAKK